MSTHLGNRHEYLTTIARNLSGDRQMFYDIISSVYALPTHMASPGYEIILGEWNSQDVLHA